MSLFPTKEYGNFRDTLVQKHYFEYSLLTFLGDVNGLTVLDLGCCEGFYCRMFKANGATQVVGVEASKEMLEVAKSHELATPLGIEYLNIDVADLRYGSKFDIVTMMLLINRAKDVSNLQYMCRVAYHHLKPGGRLAAIFTPNHKQGAEYDFKSLGFTVHCMLQNDALSRVYFSNDPEQDPETSMYNLFEKVAIEKCFRDEGFSKVDFQYCDASPLAHSTLAIWSVLFKSKVFRGVVCVKNV